MPGTNILLNFLFHPKTSVYKGIHMLFQRLVMAPAAMAATLYRPPEWHRQSQVLMAWPSAANPAYEDDIKGLQEAQDDITAIAAAVSLFEPVVLFVVPEKLSVAREQFADSANITITPVHGYDQLDLWMRDMAPTFVHAEDENRLYGVDYNFNGWGGKYPTHSCESLASIILNDIDTPRVTSWLTTEGGSLEVDGEGTLLITESSIINGNRNPGKSKDQIEAELMRTLGVEKIIWIPGRKNLEVTDGHIDGLARFISPGRVLLSKPSALDKSVWTKIYREAYDVLLKAVDAEGRRLEITEIVEADMDSMRLPRKLIKDIQSGKEDFPALTYANYLLVNDGVIFPAFGDKKADAAALGVIQSLYPSRNVHQVVISNLPFIGGGIHCATQEVPRA